MKNEKVDRLIREKIEGLSFLEAESFDTNTAWNRLEYRLEKKNNSKYGWWRYAAAFLLITSGIWQWYHRNTATGNKDISISSINTENKTQHQILKHIQPDIHLQIEKDVEEKVNKHKREKVNPNSSSRIAIQKVTVVEKLDSFTNKDAFSKKTIVSDSSTNRPPIMKDITPVGIAVRKTLPVVYYNEIIADDDKTKSAMQLAPSSKLSVSVGNLEQLPNNLATNQYSFTDHLRINLSPKH